MLERPSEGWGARIRRVLAALGGEAQVADQLEPLLDLLVEWNSRIDLTAARSADELVDLVVADAALLARASHRCGRGSASFVDIGAGAGAPGLALALFLPLASFTLVEPRTKRVAFLRTAVGLLGVTNVRPSRPIRSNRKAFAGAPQPATP